MEKRMILENLKAYYRQLKGTTEYFVKAVDGVSLEIYEGDILGLVGESGCGKSTLAKTMMMDLTPPLQYMGGRLEIISRDGKSFEISQFKNRDEVKRKLWGKHIAYVPQDALNALMPTIKIKKIAYDVLRSHDKNISFQKAVEIAKERLIELDLPDYVVELYPFQLSGGMRQRAVLAMATLLNPEILIVDEPTSALDVTTQKIVLKSLIKLRKLGFVDSIVFITHDISTVRQIANRIAVMYAGKIVEVGPTESIIREPLHPYTQGLINSVASIEPEGREKGLSYIPGQPPNLMDPPSGCRFHPRCPYAMEICRKEEPKLLKVGESQVACWLYQEGGENV
ncbi:ABC transporter ATP-binding protein [Pyrococcus woesei]|uniref:ABC transporter ATP-binding protein n=1 Tax=Pyrococcus woesei TaxID=2262 RepID=UPI003D2F410D